jgi:hypothetical protein
MELVSLLESTHPVSELRKWLSLSLSALHSHLLTEALIFDAVLVPSGNKGTFYPRKLVRTHLPVNEVLTLCNLFKLQLSK